MSLSTLLNSAENGLHPACQECPWSPKRKRNTKLDFGVSCVKHGIEWSKSPSAASMLIAQDPAGTTPSKTGNLCGYCNASFSTDYSAQHGYLLWKAAISLAESGPNANKYMKEHYWTNSIMHGVQVDKKDKQAVKENDKQRIEARAYCQNILLEQILLLSPSVIIATGTFAAESLYNLNLISKCWDEFKVNFSRQVYSERITLPTGKITSIFCTYHSSATAVNTHVARLYSDETKSLINQKIEQLSNPLPAQHFLRQFQGIRGEDKGMKVLLLHWLEIGNAIRLANAEIN